jgi:uncharacterized phiE125 gp8 family phage protein
MKLSPLRLDIDPAPTSPLPLDLTLVKSHCAVDFNDVDDLLTTYIMAAVAAFENSTHRSIVQREYRWVLAGFPIYPHERIRLPRGKTVSVTQIDHISDGSTVTLTGPTSTPAGDEYQEDLRGDDGGVLLPPQGQQWPTADCDVPDPVTITFQAGYDAATLPSDILNALLFHIRNSLDDQRTDPQKTQANLAAFETLVSGYRLSRVY